MPITAPLEPTRLPASRDTSPVPQPTSYALTFDPDRYQGYYPFETYNEKVDYMSAQERFIMVLQAKQNNLVSDDTAMENISIVTDKAKEKAMIQSDLIQNLKNQMAAQQLYSAPQNASAPLNEPEKTNYMMSKGRVGALAPPSVNGAQPPGAGMPAGVGGTVPGGGAGAPGAAQAAQATPPASSESVVDQLKDFIASIPNLSGQGIWIVGEAATKGHIDSGRLEIFIQNGNDKATIVNAVKKAIPELYGKIAACNHDAHFLFAHCGEQKIGQELESALCFNFQEHADISVRSCGKMFVQCPYV